MNLPKVWDKYKKTNVLIRQELERTQKAYKEASSTDIKLLECWDLFLYNLMKEMVEESREFVKKHLASFTTNWVGISKPGDKDWEVKMEQVQEFVNAIEKQLDKIHINLKDLF